jgi:hypothetical protein
MTQRKAKRLWASRQISTRKHDEAQKVLGSSQSPKVHLKAGVLLFASFKHSSTMGTLQLPVSQYRRQDCLRRLVYGDTSTLVFPVGCVVVYSW